jgi:hypothetical protein
VKLLVLHRVLVATAIAFCAYFVWQQVGTWKADGSVRALWIALATALVAAALCWYLANLKRFVRVEPPGARGESRRES